MEKANRLWSNEQGDLTQPLGDWVLDTIHGHRNRHFSYWSRNKLWIRNDTGYVQCNQVAHNTFKESHTVNTWEQIPAEATPMEVQPTSPRHWRWTTATCVLTQSAPTAGTFQEFIDTLPEWERELLSYTKMATDAYAVGAALEHGIRAVSDGSEWFKTQGSFGCWMLSTDIGERMSSGMGPASGY